MSTEDNKHGCPNCDNPRIMKYSSGSVTQWLFYFDIDLPINISVGFCPDCGYKLEMESEKPSFLDWWEKIGKEELYQRNGGFDEYLPREAAELAYNYCMSNK